MTDIPDDERAYQKLIQTWTLRFLRSAAWSDQQRASWVRFDSRYRLIKSAAFDPDEPNLALGYVFGLVERMTSKVTEPVLKLRPPCPVIPTRLGDLQKARNFENICRSWYSKPNMQEPFCKSKKEMVICGTRFEVDEWQNVQRDGKMWGKVPKEIDVPLQNADGTPQMKDGRQVTQKAVVPVDAEIPVKVPIHYGFHSRYPSIWDCYPEPMRSTIGTGEPTDCSWFGEDMGEMALEELCREVIYDPADGKTKHKYDLTRLLKDAGRRAQERYERIMSGGDDIGDNYGRLISPVRPWNQQSDYKQVANDNSYPAEGQVDRQGSEDRDKVWLFRGYQADELVTIANGKYIIHRKRDPWHVPLLPVRAESLQMDPRYIYGFGAIYAIEDELDEMNDVHNLSMSQFIRIVNRLQFILEGRIISMNDFKPRAGGKVRLNGDAPARDAVFEAPMSSTTSEMLALESNAKGMIEYVVSTLDGSQGVMGTKQQHKTARGMEQVVTAMAGPGITLQRQAIVNEARRMASMQRFFNQFAFDKIDYNILNEDGGNSWASFNKDDIHTEGRPFSFSVEIDPTFGDTVIQREQAIEILHEAVQYEELRLKHRDPEMKKCDISKLFERVLQKSGYVDVSGIFKLQSKEVSPEDELQMISQGATNVQCSGDLLHHIEVHIAQAMSPGLKQAVDAGKAHQETPKRLQLLIQQATAKARTFLSDPQAAVGSKIGQALKVGTGFQGVQS